MAREGDFSEHFSEARSVPEPQLSEQELKRLDELGGIGHAELKSRGLYVRLTSATPPRPAKAAAECIVLVVEDDETTAQMIVRVLERLGYRTRRARQRADVASALGMQPAPDLVLLDVNLPDVNGFDILNRVRQHPSLKRVPVLMLTGQSEQRDIARGLMLGADGYLTKPAMPSTLAEAVQSIIAGTRPG